MRRGVKRTSEGTTVVVSPSPVLPEESVDAQGQPAASESILITAPRIPRSVAQSMKDLGAIYSCQDGLTVLLCSFGDPAQQVYEKFISQFSDEVETDPHLTAFAEGDLPDHVAVPPPAVQALVVDEARSILFHYSALRAAQFRRGLPPLPPALGRPPARARYHHASMSGGQVFSRIQDPVDPLQYPNISRLAAGTYICTVDAVWMGSIVGTQIFRR